jgi:hypothetical protein
MPLPGVVLVVMDSVVGVTGVLVDLYSNGWFNCHSSHLPPGFGP